MTVSLRSTATRLAGPVLLVLAFIALARWSWLKWPDVLVDFGNQLYLPWRLSEGDVLYRDLAYKEGPLSQYLNAALFVVVGSSLRTLVWANLAFLAVLTALLYRLLAGAADRIAATGACLVFLGVFAFSQYTGVGNYNYVAPYTHEQTHGLALAVAALGALSVSLRRPERRLLVLAGLFVGLATLTKSEFAVPVLGMTFVGLGLRAATVGRGTLFADAATVAAALLVPIAAAVAVLAWPLTLAGAIAGAAGNWPYLGGDLLGDRFYRAGMGLDDPGGNLGRAALAFAAVAGTIAVAAAADRLSRTLGSARPAVAVAAGLGVFAAFVAGADAVGWRAFGRALPLTTLAAIGVLAVVWYRRRRDPRWAARLGTLLLWAVFSLVLLGKVILNVRLAHYGFVLAMPATLLLVALLLWGVPAALARNRGDGLVARMLLAAPIAAGVLFHLAWSDMLYRIKDLPVGAYGDAFLATGPAYSPRGAAMARAAEELRAVMPVDATLLVLPEGTTLNYWLRRRNPTRHTLFTPSALAFFGGEAAVLAEIAAHPPDFVALVHHDPREFGVDYFGRDPHYGRRIMEWLRPRYVRVSRIGAEPFQDARFGVVLLRAESVPLSLRGPSLRGSSRTVARRPWPLDHRRSARARRDPRRERRKWHRSR